MIIEKISIKDGLLSRNIEFCDIANTIHSIENSVGKTSFVRCILYALGYPVPSTRGLNFAEFEFEMIVSNSGKKYKIYRHNAYMTVDDDDGQCIYSVPTDVNEVMSKLTGIDNKEVLDNLLGAFYMDQEKGWTLLNRGKVIGNIAFNIESLVRGLAGVDCNDLIDALDAVNRQIKKYEYMYSVSEYQDELALAEKTMVYDSSDEILDREIELLYSERLPLDDELKQIRSILKNNKMLAAYIAQMKLIVKGTNGERIPVNKDTLIDFNDNSEILTARIGMLSSKIDDINKRIKTLSEQKKKSEGLFKVKTIIDSFDSDISKIHVNQIATKNVLSKLKNERKHLQQNIRKTTKSGNTIVDELHKSISSYAKELGVDEKYVSAKKDYIFTNDLQSLTGTVLHKIVFSFKLSYIKMIREKTGAILPIIMDSPSGREVIYKTVEEMLKIVQRDFSDHQLIVISIHDFNLMNKKSIEFKGRLFE